VAIQELVAHQVHQDTPGQVVLQVLVVILEQVVHQVSVVTQVLVDILVHLGILVFQATPVPAEHLV
jgi:hypothetical protein